MNQPLDIDIPDPHDLSFKTSEPVATEKPKAKRKFTGNDLVTEDSAALLFRDRHEGQLLYDHDLGAWFVWAGSHWRRENTGLAFDWARSLARSLAEQGEAKARLIVEKTSFASGVERFARADRAFAVTSELWDVDPFLLGTPSGTVDLRSGQVRKSNPTDKITKIAAVPPAGAPDCPLWNRFIQETTEGDDDLARFLQQFCGYALTGDIREHALVFGHGGGKNGKGVFLNTVTGIMADYATTAAMDTFTASKSDKHPTDLAMLRGARLVTASETEEGRAWAEARIKAITGGDPITARFMRQDFFTFRPTFKLFIVGNHKPVLHNIDEAARRRFNIVPFLHTPVVPDPELEEKLRAEWPAILRWMIDGCLRWQRGGLVRPSRVLEATADYFEEQDLFSQWLGEECDCDPGNRWKTAKSGELFASWKAYATAAGEAFQSQKSFSESLKSKGFDIHRGTGGTREFRGVRLKQPERADGENHYPAPAGTRSKWERPRS